MKRYKYIILVLVSVVMIMTACKKYEPYPIEKVTIDYIFDKGDSDAVNAYKFLIGVYVNLRQGHNSIGGDALDAASDDAVSSSLSQTTTPVSILSRGAYNSLTMPADENVWTIYYNGIRSATIFVNNIDAVPTRGKVNGISLKYIYKSEARFLRAHYYFELVKRYGGVPLLGNKVYQLEDDITVPRNTFEECINYIVSECNAIKDSLRTAPVTPDQVHSVTKGAALALRARALLFAASPLFNGGNTSKDPLAGYTAYDANRWKLASDAAKELLDLGTYKLVRDFRDIFLIPNNSELIFIQTGHIGATVELYNGPVGIGAPAGLGQTSPTQELVDAFPMRRSGKFITDPTSGYSINNPYGINDPEKERDLRFQYSIFYNGAKWLNDGVQTFEGGLSKPNIGTQQTLTGYYQRKFMGKFETEASVANHNVDWTVFRLAATMLDFAEAENEINGPTAKVVETIDSLRSRAGIFKGSASSPWGIKTNITQDEMRELIRNERRIELAFEQSRYFDIRRWKIAEVVMNQPRKGMTIVKAGTQLTYTVNDNVLQTKFEPRMYLYPIPYDEVVKNPNMKQNFGW
ncbi:MAG: RagB/SusD family nutrient uptake outer membrane protein [Sphingobacteriales bacterium]|nr:MAG: RagB/SusD family nutrient uptake outer membrane protein [Sphingobacteriales bacterium]